MSRSRLLILTACLAISGQVWPASAYPVRVDEDRRVYTDGQVREFVFDWLSCYECTDGELRRVMTNSTQAKPILEDLGTEISTALGTNTIAPSVPDPTPFLEVRFVDIKLFEPEPFTLDERNAFVRRQVRARYESYQKRIELAINRIDDDPCAAAACEGHSSDP